MTLKYVDQLEVGDVVLAGVPLREATVLGFSERDPGNSPVRGGTVVHLSGAHDVTVFKYQRLQVVEK